LASSIARRRETDQFCDGSGVDEVMKAAGDGMKGEGAM